MSKTIPEEVMEAARAALSGWSIDDGTSFQFEECAKSVALALLARDERAAKIADAEAAKNSTGSGFDSQPARLAALRIASAIRDRSKS